MDTSTPAPADQPPAPAAGEPPYPPAGQPPFPPAGQQPYPPAGQPPYGAPTRSGSDGFFDGIRRIGIVRSEQRWIGGVAGGIALRFGIDPLLVRGIIIVTAIFGGGAGFILYAFAWALLPEQVDGRIHLQETIHGRFDVALLGAIGLFIVGTSTDDWWFGGWGMQGFGWFSGLLWFAAIATVVGLVISSATRRGGGNPAGGPPYPARSPQYPAGSPQASTYPAPPAPGAAARAAGGYAGHAPGTPPPPPQARGYAGPAASGYASPTAGGYASPAASGYAGQPAGSYAGHAGPTAAGYAGRPARSQAGPPAGYATAPPVPPKPRRPVVHGPGSAAVGAVVGLSLVTLAGLLIADRTEGLDLSVGLTAAGIGIVLAGIGIIVAGLRGRSSGTLGFLAITGIVLAVPAAAITQGDWDTSWNNDPTTVRLIAPEGQWSPSTPAQASEGVAAAVGDLNVDLTQLATDGQVVEVPISLGAGQLTITVPSDTPVSAVVKLAAGDISWDVEDNPQEISGVSGSREYEFASDEVAAGENAQIVLHVESGAGAVRVVEVSR
ncbi:PspC domain-containing protein [Pengzhenrongella sicca]|uniref:PspC domain-containing protein n=1 Tax=Pengzhenrongella sicca TaxID=2819238 RepID=A0A8A4ZDE1_9MICO|nr:PspC domain-containing protein [Pengzhenrongella sicca]QTE29934.1 PspC domain-containing protein [Pengzhenrongella sicca]